MSSRLIIRNLPKYLQEDRLKDHFSFKGEITDVKIMRKANGESRRFAFIGYKTTQEAQAALEYFNNSFIDTAKMSIEMALPYGDDRITSQSRKYKESAMKSRSDTEETSKNERPKDKEIPAKNNAKLKEFLSTMNLSKTKAWSNDEVLNLEQDEVIEKDDDAEESESDEDKKVAFDDKVSDLDYLKSKMVPSNDEVTEPCISDEEIPEKDEAEEQVLDTGRLFVRNLPFSTTEADLTDHFSRFGPLSEVHIPIDKDSKKSIGIAYLLFLIPENALTAMKECDGKIFLGRLIHILPAAEKVKESVESQDKKSFKQKQLEKVKANQSNEFVWNSLYLNPDAVMDSVSKKLSIPKSELLNPDHENLAVRMAIAETHLIQETKEFLQENGVNVDAIGKKERSNTVILVKNIPSGTTLADLQKVFSRTGSIGRILLPPNNTIALIEYLNATEAKTSFKILAFSRFKSVPLFLEWAPLGILKPANVASKISDDSGSDDSDDQAAANICTIYIKNLNFASTQNDLKSIFEGFPGFKSCKVAMKKKNDKLLSMGYGFAEFSSLKEAKTALQSLKDVVLHDHCLQLKLSKVESSKSSDAIKKSAKASTKILVKNIPFEANLKELKEIFRTFGNVKKIRIPKKIDGSHRGFGFVEYFTVQEAKRAFESLFHTHFYGRHLVLEWAEASDSIESLREKTKRRFKQDLTFEENTDSKRMRQEDDDL